MCSFSAKIQVYRAAVNHVETLTGCQIPVAGKGERGPAPAMKPLGMSCEIERALGGIIRREDEGDSRTRATLASVFFLCHRRQRTRE